MKNEVTKKTEYNNKLVKKVNAIQTIGTSNLFKKLIKTQKLIKLKRKLLITIMLNILLLKNLIS